MSDSERRKFKSRKEFLLDNLKKLRDYFLGASDQNFLVLKAKYQRLESLASSFEQLTQEILDYNASVKSNDTVSIKDRDSVLELIDSIRIAYFEAEKQEQEAKRIKVSDQQKVSPNLPNIHSPRVHLSKLNVPENRKKKSKFGCACCNQGHFLAYCPTFKGKSLSDKKEFITQHKLCTNCLGPHDIGNCRSDRTCKKCNLKHHSLLHQDMENRAVAQEERVSNHLSCSINTVLLSTATIIIEARGNLEKARALIDQGSEASFISKSLAQRLRINHQPSSIIVSGVGGKPNVVTRGCTNIKFGSRYDQSVRFQTEALILPKLTDYLPPKIESFLLNEFTDVDLAEEDMSSKEPVEVILGAEIFAVIVQEGIRKACGNTVLLQNTSLGWIVSGAFQSDTRGTVRVHSSVLDKQLLRQMRRFWEMEEPQLKINQDDQECENQFNRTHCRNPESRFIIKLPIQGEPSGGPIIKFPIQGEPSGGPIIKFPIQGEPSGEPIIKLPIQGEPSGEPIIKLPIQGEPAGGLIIKLPFKGESSELGQSKPAAQRALSYCNGRLGKDKELSTFYHAFFQEYCDLKHMKIISKIPSCHYFLPHNGVLRPSSKTTNLRVGSNASRKTSSGKSMSDVHHIWPQLLSNVQDRVLRWRKYRIKFSANVEKMFRQILVEEGDQAFQLWRDQIYQSQTVTYGTACAPYLAIRVLRQLADLENLPLGREIIYQEIYMDDVLSGADNVQESMERRNQLIELSDRARPFDPLGYASPILIKPKIFLQSLWTCELNWDPPLPEKLARQWQKLHKELAAINLEISRWIHYSAESTAIEIHGFSGASQKAMSAVLNIIVTTGNRQRISLLGANTKVAPLKQIFLPRLELNAAVLLSRIFKKLITPLSLPDIDKVHLWTDSTFTLYWICNQPSRWTTFVANRVSEIQTSIHQATWGHLPSEDNPADCATRGLTNEELANHQLWWSGPDWLREDSESWPQQIVIIEEPLEEGKKLSVHHAQSLSNWIEEFSSLRRLIRTTAYRLRFIGKLRRTGKESGPLSTAELSNATRRLIKEIQKIEYGKEIENLKLKKEIPKNSSLIKLNPFLDEEEILRVGGRLTHADLEFSKKHPIIMPHKQFFSTLVVREAQSRTLRGGTQLTLATIRQQYWICRGRQPVKSVIKNCITCRRFRGSTRYHQMGNLPKQRVQPSRPFTHLGIDYAGPLTHRTAKGRGHRSCKNYIAVFVCFCSRAIHLEVVSDYTADGLLAAYRRLISRRGVPASVTNDRGTNFIGADQGGRG